MASELQVPEIRGGSDALLFLAAAEFLPASCALAWSSPLLCNIREKQLCVRLDAWPYSRCPPPCRLSWASWSNAAARVLALLALCPLYPVPLSPLHTRQETQPASSCFQNKPLPIDQNSTHSPLSDMLEERPWLILNGYTIFTKMEVGRYFHIYLVNAFSNSCLLKILNATTII